MEVKYTKKEDVINMLNDLLSWEKVEVLEKLQSQSENREVFKTASLLWL